MTQFDELFVQIAKFVLKKSDFSFTRAQTMIKSHTENLSQMGEIGFPTTIQPWLNVIENPNDLNDVEQVINENEAEFARKLIEISSTWMFPVQDVKFDQFRCLLFLDRSKCYSNILKTVLYDDAHYGQWYCTNGVKSVYDVQLLKQSHDNSLIEHRCALVAKMLYNAMKVSGFEMISPAMECGFDAKNVVEILVDCARRDDPKTVNRRNNVELNNNVKSRLIVCGNVKSESGYTTEEIIRRCSLDMKKRAESKYGEFKESVDLDKCQKLGTAIVTFELLKIKHYTPIDLDKQMTKPSTINRAAFILYNVARLQTLLASFDQKVTKGFYAPLPDFNQIDFELLKTEEEWQLFYVYVVGFPSMLERSVSCIANGQIAIHLLCTFLNNLSTLFSAYYHRVKILTDNLPQLMPVMYARIYLLKALRVIFLKFLMILEIEPLDEM